MGAGAGVAVPHVEATVGRVRTEEYELAGWGIQGLAGLSVELTRWLSAFVEYKLDWADVDVDLNGVGSIRQDFWTHRLLFGLSWRF